ncbi:hypothetical protein [Microcoleus phage My-WqHQDG]|nr:hypothetical protein [Microcoleus phage My-WqHQDG]
MPLSTLMPILFALALCVLAAPPKPPAKRKRDSGDGGNGISINIYQQGSTIPPKVVVRDSNK